ncbi:hypothetical protein [Tenacibaculum amylolyticum]|uniref:hypothetical protein n=1 Tax=Tenacibaculum amylolyticum TaxID=104269 RepID=UPI0038B4FA40
MKNIQDDKYDYRILIQHNYKKENIDSIKKRMKTRGISNYSFQIESSLLKSDSNNKIIVGYTSSYCFPDRSIKNQLRIIIARKEKSKSDIELMYSLCKLAPGRTEIIVKKFEAGQRKCEVFEYQKDYLSKKNVDYGRNQYLNLKSRKIFLK